MLALICAPAIAFGGSLPSVRSGERPGPPLLFGPAPEAPQLGVKPPFTAAPLLVSGTDAYRDGEYLYQDYLFDDRGADTMPGEGSRFENGRNLASPTAGDVLYPLSDRYAGNAADLVELRIKPQADTIVYRVTLNTMRAPDAAVVGIGIDTDRSGGAPAKWPRGAGISSPGLDRFITAWGTGGEVTSLPGGPATPLPAGSVSVDTGANQMTIRVPRSIMDPGTSTWRYVAGVGLWSGSGWKPVPPGTQATSDQAASGNALLDAPAVYNLAFRFDEPQTNQLGPPYTTAPGIGNWFEDKQALNLRQRTSGDFHADVDFARLAAGANASIHAPGRVQARVFASRFEPYEGVRPGFPGYGTRLQPYILVVPPSYDPSQPAPFTLALHSGDSTYTQYAVNNPKLYAQLGDQRRSIVLTPFGRGPDTFYTGIGEADIFEAWADVARHFTLDPGHVAISGYSVGGYGTYRLGAHYPDLFGRAFTAVGLPAIQGWIPPAPPQPGGQVSNTNQLLENVRWLPYLQWAQATDEINPFPGVRAQQDRLSALGLRSQLSTFTSGDHFTLAIEDEFAAARDFLGDAPVSGDPGRVDYAFLPQAETPEFGIRPDHAYWVSALRARNRSGDLQTAPARARISATSLAFGESDPLTRQFLTGGAAAGSPMPTTVEGTEWTSIPRTPAENGLRVSLENVSSAAIDGCRARLTSATPLRITVVSDGPGEVALALPLAAGVTVNAQGPGAAGRVSRAGARLSVGRGSAAFTISSPRAVACGAAAPGAARTGLSLSVAPRSVAACRGTLFRFRVRAGGVAVPAAAVHFGGRRVLTDQAGHARLRLVLRRRGRYRVRASKGGRRATAFIRATRSSRCARPRFAG